MHLQRPSRCGASMWMGDLVMCEGLKLHFLQLLQPRFQVPALCQPKSLDDSSGSLKTALGLGWTQQDLWRLPALLGQPRLSKRMPE